MSLRKFALLALLATLVLVQQVPATPKLSLHTQLFSENIPGQQLVQSSSTPLLLSFNLAGHDVGSDKLRLIFNQNTRLGNTNGFPAIILGLNSTQNTYCMNNNCYGAVIQGSPAFVPKFVVSCGTLGSSASQTITCSQTITYSPLTESQFYILFFTATSGDAASLVGGTHTWTVTTIS